MSAHTKGPWRLDGAGMIRDTRGRVIAQVGRVGTPDENVSNGFLIEAAPELLLSLRKMLAFARGLDEQLRATGGQQLAFDECRTVERAYAAIAKATIGEGEGA